MTKPGDFSDSPIRRKLAAVMTVPMTAVLFVAAVQLVQSGEAARQTNEQAEVADATAGVDSLAARLQQESNLTGIAPNPWWPSVQIRMQPV